jgi:hypothetical protein
MPCKLARAQPRSGKAPQAEGRGVEIVLFGIGSPIVAEYVEICLRLEWPIIAGIRNQDGKVFFEDESPGRWIDGPFAARFAADFAACCRAKRCVPLANSTDALELALRALGVGPATRSFEPTIRPVSAILPFCDAPAGRCDAGHGKCGRGDRHPGRIHCDPQFR